MFILALMVLGCGASGSTAPKVVDGGAARVHIDELLLADGQVPKAIKGRMNISRQLVDVRSSTDVTFIGASAYRIRSWSDKTQGGAPSLSEVVYEFPQQVEAEEYYSERDVGENFHLADGMAATSLDVESSEFAADDHHVFCVAYKKRRTVENCEQWGARMRYKQFVVDLVARQYDANRGYTKIPKHDFLDFVAAADGHIAQLVGNS
ncbi:hypothetical protein LDL08_38665 [Nonomuraea glycinis]|nr:hypothetical protein [Nonomuraea glycinis]MCA2182103.1 hypothetical protein [Nonomuraea glycinis]